MGLILYWKNGNKSDLKKGVHFSSSDPHMIKFFLKWLRGVGEVEDNEIRFDIFIKTNTSFQTKKLTEYAANHWSKITKFSKGYFTKFYFQKSNKSRRGLNAGFLRIRVAQSSMLARQIFGWIEGIKNLNNI